MKISAGRVLPILSGVSGWVVVLIMVISGVCERGRRKGKIEQQLQWIIELLPKIEETLDTLNTRVSGLMEFKKGIGGKFDSMNEKVNSIDKRLVRVETIVKMTSQKLDSGLNTQIASSQRVERRIREITHTLSFLNSPLLEEARKYAFFLRGTVYRDRVSKKPIPDARIEIEGYPQYSTSTSSEGRFTLSVPKKATRLSIQASGFKKKTLDLPKKPSAEVNLDPIYLMEE